MRAFPIDWQNYSEVTAWEKEVAALRVRVRLADGTEVDLSGDTGADNAGRAAFALGATVHHAEPDPNGVAPLGECAGRHMSAVGRLAQFLPGSIVRVHREDVDRSAYVVEVVANVDPIDCTRSETIDPSARRPAAVVESFDDFNARRHGNA
jgi:hypothetical protein